MSIATSDGTAQSTGVFRATVERVVMLGFEVRVELTSAATGGSFTAQITRGDAEAQGLKEGDTVFVRATRVPSIAGDVRAPTRTDPGEDQTMLTARAPRRPRSGV
jgi:sulfate transport system ATP-binding protein